MSVYDLSYIICILHLLQVSSHNVISSQLDTVVQLVEHCIGITYRRSENMGLNPVLA